MILRRGTERDLFLRNRESVFCYITNNNPTTKRQNELYIEIRKLSSQSTNFVPAVQCCFVPCCQQKLGKLTKTANETYYALHFVS